MLANDAEFEGAAPEAMHDEVAERAVGGGLGCDPIFPSLKRHRWIVSHLRRLAQRDGQRRSKGENGGLQKPGARRRWLGNIEHRTFNAQHSTSEGEDRS